MGERKKRTKQKGLSSKQMSALYKSFLKKGLNRSKSFKKVGKAKRISMKLMNSNWKKGKFGKDAYIDYDGDGVVNKYDCRPFNRYAQDKGIIEKGTDWLLGMENASNTINREYQLYKKDPLKYKERRDKLRELSAMNELEAMKAKSAKKKLAKLELKEARRVAERNRILKTRVSGHKSDRKALRRKLRYSIDEEEKNIPKTKGRIVGRYSDLPKNWLDRGIKRKNQEKVNAMHRHLGKVAMEIDAKRAKAGRKPVRSTYMM